MTKRRTDTAMKKAGAPEPERNFESSLAALEKIVRELEHGELPLEKSLSLFEQGVRLTRECQERLNEAERRIEVLLRDSEGRTTTTTAAALGAFTADETDEDEGDAENDESVF